MQGNFGSEHALPLNELLTVLLITHNRPAFLRRALEFYSPLPCRIIVLDSSVQTSEGVADGMSNVDYRHLPQFGYWDAQAKVVYGIDQVTTPYTVFAADDDFLIHDSVVESVKFLEANPDYGMCHGYCLMYLALANSVTYYRRDKKVCEDYASERAQDRVLDFMNQFIPPFYAVHRTSLFRDWYAAMPNDAKFEWQEIGHTFYMLAQAKARILPMAYVVREINYIQSEHKTEVYHSLTFTDSKSVAEREAFAEFLAGLTAGQTGLDLREGKAFALQAFEAMAESLICGRALAAEIIFESYWKSATQAPERRFGPRQYVEMPFYNQVFFDELTHIEFLLHGLPAGRLQLEKLEGVWARQHDLIRARNNDTAQSVVDRLWQAHDCNMFDRDLVKRLARQLDLLGEQEDAEKMSAWATRLDTLPDPHNQRTFAATRSGRLLQWLEARQPDHEQAEAAIQYLAARQGPPQFGIMVLDLEGDIDKLQVTLDSLLEGHCKSFRIVVLTTGEPLAATTPQNLLHFVRVSLGNYVDKLNQVARQSPCEWLLLVEAGDEFTASGLLRADLELLDATSCRAVMTDEIQRAADGALMDVFRPGFNLDLLQSVPALMARHWLIRREVLVAVGGYSADFSKALEFDLLLRVIEQGGMAGLAHLDEPLLISRAVEVQENPQERQSLLRHLGTRGYKAQVSSPLPGTYLIDYRHTARPLVSIILQSQDNLPALQRCLAAVLQRTRYTHYEVLIVDNHSQSAAVAAWLEELARQGGKVSVIRLEQRLETSALHNVASQQAQGEYLVLLSAESEVVNPNWIESLLNQAQRPEVGIVGAKLFDRDTKVFQAGLLLGLNGAVGSPFVGEDKDAKGYLQRLVVGQNYSAVSSVCLMIRHDLYNAVGGMDEEVFVDALGDVDLCLKVGQAGYLIVWTPQVQVLYSGEVAQAASAIEALREKWADAFAHDPAYNLNLSLSGKGFALGAAAGPDWARLLV
ncbi:glycosyl transferase family 2 [Pseudomonas agarici]|uniref:Glycosyl transferase family 2 n=1 Tax=Pseudomonas agarici TaxID=46677 RepID=A0A0X1SZS6_PSEAA|nr:TIGR00180 family glycosyltransferase [Pseudomonas agarici]AMB85332.1 glycosyl transferase family 2 [Pseudomonas agarici]